MSKKISLLQFLRYCFLFTIIFNGFIYNYLHLFFLPDVFGLSIIMLIISRRLHKTIKLNALLVFSLIFLASTLLISVISLYSFALSLKGIRSYILFALYGFVGFGTLKERERKGVINCVALFGTLLCFFAIIQFLFFDYLPKELIAYGANINTFMRSGMRVNGLMPNPICFGFFSVIMFIILFVGIVEHSFKWFLSYPALIIVIISTVLTYSRAAIFGIAVSALLIILFFSKYNILKKTIFIAFGLLFVAIAIKNAENSELLMRLFSIDSGAIASTNEHLADFDAAFYSLSKNPIFGIGFATQGYDRGDLVGIITDGSFLAMMLELGIPTVIFFVIVLMICSYKSLVSLRNDPCHRYYYVVAFLVIIFIFFSNLINSAFTFNVNYCIAWIIIGILNNLILNNKCSVLNKRKPYVANISQAESVR